MTFLFYCTLFQVCGLSKAELSSIKVKCKYCPSMLRSISVPLHEQYCSGIKLLQEELLEAEKDRKILEATEEEIELIGTDLNDSTVGRPARKSAKM